AALPGFDAGIPVTAIVPPSPLTTVPPFPPPSVILIPSPEFIRVVSVPSVPYWVGVGEFAIDAEPPPPPAHACTEIYFTEALLGVYVPVSPGPKTYDIGNVNSGVGSVTVLEGTSLTIEVRSCPSRVKTLLVIGVPPVRDSKGP